MTDNKNLIEIIREVLSDKLSKSLADKLTAEIREKLLENMMANMYADKERIDIKLRNSLPIDEREMLEGLRDSLDSTIKQLEQELSDMSKKGNS